MKQILYSLLFLGSLATFTGCEEADYQELIPQEYNKILYLKNSGQNDLVLFNDGQQVKYSITVVKSGSDPSATAQVRLSTLSQTEIDNESRYKGNNYVVLNSDCKGNGLAIVADSLIGFNALRNSIEDFDSEEALPHPYQWNNFSPEEVANHDEKAARNVLRRMHHVNDITPRDFVEVCVDMKQQGVGGYDSWGARPEPFHQIPANRDYSWGFTLVPVRSASQANEVAKYDYQ